MKLGTLTVSGRKFRLPCVYEFLLDGTVLYVGRLDAGFSRAFRGNSSGHDQGRVIAFNQADQIRVAVFDNTQEAHTEEIRLIELHRPKHNTQYNRGRKQRVKLQLLSPDVVQRIRRSPLKSVL